MEFFVLGEEHEKSKVKHSLENNKLCKGFGIIAKITE